MVGNGLRAVPEQRDGVALERRGAWSVLTRFAPAPRGHSTQCHPCLIRVSSVAKSTRLRMPCPRRAKACHATRRGKVGSPIFVPSVPFLPCLPCSSVATRARFTPARGGRFLQCHPCSIRVSSVAKSTHPIACLARGGLRHATQLVVAKLARVRRYQGANAPRSPFSLRSVPFLPCLSVLIRG
jgi:hypothetical protein